MLKKISSILLIILLLSQSALANDILPGGDIATFEASAPYLTGGVYTEAVQVFDKGDVDDSAGFFANMTFAEYIFAYIDAYIEEYGELPTAISGIAQFGVTAADIRAEYFAPVARNPYTLLQTGCSYYLNSDNVVSVIYPKYLVSSVDELEEARQDIRDGVAEYVALANEYDTDLEKLLAIHDKMVENCVYDERVMSTDPSVVAQAPDSVYHAIGVFRDKFAVCQGYSQAIYLICNELGIGVDLCDSKEVNHMWNYINLGGKWYHIDMTNEDPKDAQGRATHRFFLIPDSSLDVQAHGTDWSIYGSDEKYTCNDTTYLANHFFNTGFLFKGIKNSDGCYHASIGIKNTSAGIDTTVTFKSPTLYTGATIVAPFITYGKYTVMENGSLVSKTGTNLYMIERAVGSSPATFPIIRYKNTFRRLSDKAATAPGATMLRIVAPDAEGVNLSDFTSFIFGVDDLTPYSMKNNWH